MSLLVRSLVCPSWRRIVLTSMQMPRRQSTSTSAFSNIQASLTHNRLVFEYKDSIIPFLAGIGLLQFVALDLVAYWSFYIFGTVTAREDQLKSDSTLLERAATVVPTNRFRYATTASIVVLSEWKTYIVMSYIKYILGSAIFAVCIIYPSRCIRRLYLLKDGSSVGIVTYSLWPSARKFTIPLEHVSSHTALHGVGIFHKLKLKTYRFSHLVNRKDGHFYEKSIYETVIALKRF
jgi:hypothetical protein